MLRRIPFSRLLDIISGSAIAGANTKVQKGALRKDFDIARLESNKLRDLIDSNLPTFYVVDCKLVAEETIKALTSDYSKYFQENEDYVLDKISSVKSSVPALTKALQLVFGSTIPSKPFLPVYNKLDVAYNKLLDKLSKRSSYIGYRNAAILFGNEIRSILKTTGAFAASDGSNIVQGLPDTSVVVVGPTFEYTKRKVNEELNAVISGFVTLLDLTLTQYNKGSGFTVGNIVNAGHTSASTNTGQFIGINMPMAQEKQFLLSGTGKEQGVEDAISSLYLDSNYSIKFDQNFVKGATNLLNMQFSFVVSMPKEFNTNELRIGEVKNIKEYIGNTILPDIKEQALNKFKQGLLLDILPEISASPNISEFLSDTVLTTMAGTKPSVSIVKSSTLSAIDKSISINVLKNTSILGKIKTSSSSANIKLRTTNGTFYSASSLMTLINDQLSKQIEKNMGTGTSRTLLNFRSGRLADSAKVERMSVSREGMITAFYSYMNNPYGTFSVGGLQSMPASRDPKLLISKSIREIAATKVANRMRAVLI